MSASSLLTRIEERYLFRLSRSFWHVVTLLGVLIVAVALAVLGWAYLPAQERAVSKASYPAPVEISPEEIQERLKPVPAPAAPEKTLAESPKAADQDPDRVAFTAAVQALRKALPDPQFAWQDKGRWEYPYGYGLWEYTLDSDYRRWVVTQKGIISRLNETLDGMSSVTLGQQAKILETYATTLNVIPMGDRMKVFTSMTMLTKGHPDDAVASIVALGKVVSALGSQRAPKFEQLAGIVSAHQSEGMQMVTGLGGIIGSFDATARVAALDAFSRAFVSRFEGKYEQQREAVERFMGMLPQVAPKDQARYLAAYLDLFAEKNVSRQLRIQEIDAKFADDVARAEADALASRMAKETSRPFAWYALGIGVGTAAFFALFLVMLSIQRNLKALVEVMGARPVEPAMVRVVPEGSPAQLPDSV